MQRTRGTNPTQRSKARRRLCLIGTALRMLIVPAVGAEAATAIQAAEPEWLGGITRSLTNAEYKITMSARGLQAPNRAAGFRTYFREGRIEVVPRTTTETEWSFAWSTTGFGREAALRTLATGEPEAVGSSSSLTTAAWRRSAHRWRWPRTTPYWPATRATISRKAVAAWFSRSR